jgi:hypothetical protein
VVARRIHVIAAAVMLAGCARVYSLRVTGGVERASRGDRGTQVLVTLGIPIGVAPDHFVVVTGRAGTSPHRDPAFTTGAGLEWMLARGRAIVRLGPDYLTRLSPLDDDKLAYRGLGARAGLLFAFARSEGESSPGVIDALFDHGDDGSFWGLGYGTDGASPASSHEKTVTRRHGVGLEASGSLLFGGTVPDRGLGYVGLAYEYDVLPRE